MSQQLINKTNLINKLKSLSKQKELTIDDCIKEIEWTPCVPNYKEWISTLDYEPDIEDCYLIAWGPLTSNGRKFHFYQIAEWSDGCWHYDKGTFKNRKCEVLAWMTLPGQFKGE